MNTATATPEIADVKIIATTDKAVTLSVDSRQTSATWRQLATAVMEGDGELAATYRKILRAAIDREVARAWGLDSYRRTRAADLEPLGYRPGSCGPLMIEDWFGAYCIPAPRNAVADDLPWTPPMLRDPRDYGLADRQVERATIAIAHHLIGVDAATAIGLVTDETTYPKYWGLARKDREYTRNHPPHDTRWDD